MGGGQGDDEGPSGEIVASSSSATTAVQDLAEILADQPVGNQDLILDGTETGWLSANLSASQPVYLVSVVTNGIAPGVNKVLFTAPIPVPGLAAGATAAEATAAAANLLSLFASAPAEMGITVQILPTNASGNVLTGVGGSPEYSTPTHLGANSWYAVPDIDPGGSTVKT
jgi:hypothetical protein